MNAQSNGKLEDTIMDIVVSAAGGEVSQGDLEEAKGSLKNAGYTSLAYMALIAKLESTFGVIIDAEQEPDFLYTLDGIATFIREQLTEAPSLP